MRYLGVDVGIVHLALIGIEIDDLERNTIIKTEEIYLCKLINITELVSECTDTSCKLHHEKTVCDYMTHLFQKHRQIFEEADKILIERQPLQGLVSVQDLILREYRSKCSLISPNSMHKYFGINHLDYEQRKVAVEKQAEPYLNGFKEYVFNLRKHDMADAFCILYFHLSELKKEAQKLAERRKFEKTHSEFLKRLESYRYDETLNNTYSLEENGQNQRDKPRLGDFSKYRYSDPSGKY